MKLTDNEIIKALECCRDNGVSNTYCDDCAYSVYEDCGARQAKDTLDLIKRQKAEIERLQAMVEREREKYERTMTGLKAVLEERADHSEAIKEFAERLRNATMPITLGGKYKYDVITKEGIDNLVKEMVGDNNG